MTLFDASTWRGASVDRLAPAPAGFEALADALAGGGSIDAVAEEIGRRGGFEGVAIDELLRDLAKTYDSVRREAAPPYDITRALVNSWADAAIRYLHGVTCEDPLTGLVTVAHLRTRLSEIYRTCARDGLMGRPAFAILVVEVHWTDTDPGSFDRVMRMLDLAEIMRHVYDGDEVIGELTPSRVAAVVRRDARLGETIGSLLGLLGGWEQQARVSTRLWLEGFPASLGSAEAMLDELAR